MAKINNKDYQLEKIMINEFDEEINECNCEEIKIDYYIKKNRKIEK